MLENKIQKIFKKHINKLTQDFDKSGIRKEIQELRTTKKVDLGMNIVASTSCFFIDLLSPNLVDMVAMAAMVSGVIPDTVLDIIKDKKLINEDEETKKREIEKMKALIGKIFEDLFIDDFKEYMRLADKFNLNKDKIN